MRPGECLDVEAAPGERDKFVLLAGRRDAFALRERPLSETTILLTLCRRLP